MIHIKYLINASSTFLVSDAKIPIDHGGDIEEPPRYQTEAFLVAGTAVGGTSGRGLHHSKPLVQHKDFRKYELSCG